MILSKQQLSIQKLSIEQMSQILKSEIKIERVITKEALSGDRYHEK